jgi:membrane associated rhomboid family serine protease
MAGRFPTIARRSGPGDPWFRLGELEVTTSAIVPIIFLFSVLMYGVKKSVLERFWFVTPLVTDGEVWRILTWPLSMFGAPSIWDVASAAMFWYFGSQLEREIGRVRFLLYVALLTIVPAMLSLPFALAIGGISLLELFVLVGWALANRNAKFFFGIPAPVLAGVFVVITMINYSGSGAFGGVVFVAVGALLSPLLLRSFGLLSDLPQIPVIPGVAALATKLAGDGRTSTGVRAPSRRRAGTAGRSAASNGKRKLQGLPPLREDQKVIQGPWPTGPISQGEVDRLLDKIADEGIDSLSSEERRLLDDASRRLRQRHDE